MILGYNLNRVYAIYQSTGGSSLTNKDLIVTVTDVENGKESPKRPLSKRDLAFIKKAIQSGKNKAYAVSEKDFSKLIYFKQFPLKLIWKVPAERRKIETTEGLQTVAFPKLIFMLEGDTLKVFHYKKYKGEYQVSPATNLPNTYSNHVCMGNVKTSLDFGNVNLLMASWENYFFLSKFEGKVINPEPPQNIEYVKLELNDA